MRLEYFNFEGDDQMMQTPCLAEPLLVSEKQGWIKVNRMGKGSGDGTTILGRLRCIFKN